jgi:predicted phage terminase large subunit-like protein
MEQTRSAEQHNQECCLLNRRIELMHQELKLLCENSFYSFVKTAFKIIHSDEEFVDNWHIKYLCDELQKEVERIIENKPKEKNIIINIPPRSLKSFITTISLPAWSWIKKPSLKIISTSYSADLSIEHNVVCRRIIESEWYQENWGSKVKLAGDQNAKSKFENTNDGTRYATSVGGTITGGGGNIIILDDPQNPKQAHSDVERQHAIDYYEKTLFSRLDRPKIDIFIIVMQRLHGKDLTGHLLSKNKENYRHICIPAEVTKDLKPIELKEKYIDGLFFSRRFTIPYLKSYKETSGSFEYSGQMLQSPYPEEGGIIKISWIQRYNVVPVDFDFLLDSWDLSVKDKETSDYACGVVWGIKGALKYVLHVDKQKIGFADSMRAIMSIRQRFPQISKTIIEDKANGSPVIEVLKNKISGVIPYCPSINKISRLRLCEPDFEAGQVLLPTNDIATFDVEDYINSLTRFPNLEYDDDVDATTTGLIYIKTEYKKASWSFV